MLMRLGNLIYKYEQRKESPQYQIADLKTSILEIIKENDMAPIYSSISERFSWEIDNSLLESMTKKIHTEIASIDAKIEDSEKNAGDTEVIDGLFTKARYFSKIGRWSEALSTFDSIINRPKTVTGKKIDANMDKVRILLFTLDNAQLKSTLDEAKRLNDSGGDWDRRNRLKIYEAFYLLSVRDVKQAGGLLLDCIATFTCTELCTYQEFMFLAIVTNIILLDRNALRKKLIQDPQVITVSRDLATPTALLQSIYNCDYRLFFESIVGILPELNEDRFLGPLTAYLVREYRVLAYAQFLNAYKSVMLSSMAGSFGITSALLDSELSRFIAAGRLNAKIDKVGDIIETRRPDKKNAQYHEVIKKGDQLLNQVQRLVRVIDV